MKSEAERELITIDAMIFDYCRSKHQTRQTLCPDCQKLLDYATNRIVNCKLGKRKTTCAQCPVHCFAPQYRNQIREVMRFAGPRMLYKHPILAFYHLLGSRIVNKQ